jgi:hypothetical protein
VLRTQRNPSCLAPFTQIQWNPFFNYRLSTFHYKWLGSLCPKSRNAKGCLLFFTRRFTLSVLHSTSSPRRVRFVPVLRGLFECRNPASALLTINNLRYRYNYFLLRYLGVFNCRFHKNSSEKLQQVRSCIFLKRKGKNPARIAFIPHFQSVILPSIFVSHFCCYNGFLFFSFFFSKKLRSNL